MPRAPRPKTTLRRVVSAGVRGAAGWLAWWAAAAPAAELPELDCVMEPYAVVEISSPVPGVIAALLVERSSPVVVGQPLLQLQSGVQRADLAIAHARAEMEAEVRLREASAAHSARKKTRTDELHLRRVVSPQLKDDTDAEATLSAWRLRQAEDNRRLAALELERAEQILDLRTIRSPLNGFVVERFKSVGEYLEDQPALKLVQLDPLRVEVIVPVQFFGEVQPGRQAEVVPEAAGEKRLVGTVSLVDRIIDTASGTFGVTLELPNPGPALPGGLRCRVRFLEAHTLPDAGAEAPRGPGASGAAPPARRPPPRPAVPDRELEHAPPPHPAPPSSSPTVYRPADPQPSTVPMPAPTLVPTPPEAASPPASSRAVTDAPRSAPSPLCRTAGPFPDAPAASRFASLLRERGAQAAVRNVSGPASQYLVVSAHAMPSAEAAALHARLRARGVEDIALMNGTDVRRIAYGLYQSEAWARKRLAALQLLGVSATVEARGARASLHFVDLQIPRHDGSAAHELSSATARGVEVREAGCGGLVASAS